MRVINLNKLIVFATPRTRSQHKKKLRSRNFGADKQCKFDYLFENCSSVKKTVLWDTLHKEGIPPDFDISGFMLFSSGSVAFLPYGVGSLLPYLRG